MRGNDLSLAERRSGPIEETSAPAWAAGSIRYYRALCLLAVMLTGQGVAQQIETRVLTAAAPMRITVNPNVATTLLFPDAIGGAFGLGLVGAGVRENQTAAPGSIALEHPEGSPLMVLHALTPGAKVLKKVE